MIRFACSSCGKRFRKDDSLAGRRGKCSCGYIFRVPGVRVSQASVFVPADNDPPPFDVQLMPRRPKSGGSPWTPVLIGLVIGCFAIVTLFQFRDPIVANVPALQPLLPPKAAPPPIARAAPVAAPDDRHAEELSRWIFSASICVLFFVLPMVLPATYSRRRYLSVGRWLIMAGLCFFLTLVGGLLVEVATILQFRGEGDFGSLKASGFLLTIPAFFGIGGCLLAAAVYPKDRPVA